MCSLDRTAAPAAGRVLALDQRLRYPSDVGDEAPPPGVASWRPSAGAAGHGGALREAAPAEPGVPVERVRSAPASSAAAAAPQAEARADRAGRTRHRLAELLGAPAAWPGSAAAAAAGPPGRVRGVLSTEPAPSPDMAAVPVRRAASGPAPCELAASRSARTKGRLARLLEQDEEGPRYVCSLRLERDLMERSGRMGSKSSVGDMSTEGDGEGSVSRTWSKGSAGEDNMSRAWSKSSTGEDNMSRAWSKGSAIPFFGHSPSWSASSDHSPRADGLTRFGMPLDMVAETESGTASNELGEAFRGPLGQATLAPGVMPVMLMPAEVAVAASPTYAAGQDSRPSRTIALSVQPELSASARPPSPAALSAGGPSAAQPRRMSWADVSLTAQPSQECSHEVFQPASCGVRHQPGQRAQRPRQPPHQAMQQQRQDEAREQQQLPAALKGSAQRPDDEVGGVTMRDLLRMLKDKEHRCVILTRRIQYLGFSAPTQLEDHFGAFGPVQDVLVPQSHVKHACPPCGSKRSRQAAARQRPAHLGFVIMETAAGAAAAFAAGAEHEIGGATIVLEPFDEARWKAGSGELEQQ